MAGEDQPSSSSEGPGAGEQEADDSDVPVPHPVSEPVALPSQSPLFHAQHADRYDRQQGILAYEAEFRCRLVVMSDAIFHDNVTLFEDLIYDADPNQPLHLMLNSPGGDGETAVRLARQAQSRCSELVVIVPDQAKSAATLLCMGAHEILMGPTSDLGPVDPQFRFEDGSLASAKDIIAAVTHAEEAVQQRPETYPIHAALLENLTELRVQQARSAIDRTDQLAIEALLSRPGRSTDDAAALWESLKNPLAIEPASHSAVFDAGAARTAGLPVKDLDPTGRQWQMIWRTWVKYALMGPARVYEGRRASHIYGPPPTM